MRASRQRAPGTTAGAQREPHGSPSISAYRQSERLAVLENTGRRKKRDGKGQGARIGSPQASGRVAKTGIFIQTIVLLGAKRRAPVAQIAAPGSARRSLCARVASIPFANPATPAALVMRASRLEPSWTRFMGETQPELTHHATSRARPSPDPGIRQPGF